MKDKKRLRLLLMILLLVIVLAVFFQIRKKNFLSDLELREQRIEEKRNTKDATNIYESYHEAEFSFVPYSGTVRIFQDLETANIHTEGETGLDGMDHQQIARFRLDRVGQYSQLGFFHDKYDPFKYHHRRIYRSITPGERWLGPTPYYIANPYLLIILTCANHVTPLNLLCQQVDITYNDGVIEEIRTGNSARCWFHVVFRSSDYPGKVWPIMVNAWDAGFFFMTVDLTECDNIETSVSPSHVTNRVLSSRYFYHVGKYQKNNLSPTVRDAWLTLKERDMETVIYIKLWRH